MAITNYTELRQAVADWLHRTDLTDVIPDLIRLAEDKLNLLIVPHVTASETSTTYNVSAGSTTVGDLPDDCQKVVSLTSNNSYMPYWHNWYVSGNTIYLKVPIGEPRTFVLNYKQKLNIAQSNTNWLLTKYPESYLYATLLEASPYVVDDARTALWTQLFVATVQNIIDTENVHKDLATMYTEVSRLARG